MIIRDDDQMFEITAFYGEVAEWLMAPVLKTGEGSNPVLRGFESHPRLSAGWVSGLNRLGANELGPKKAPQVRILHPPLSAAVHQSIVNELYPFSGPSGPTAVQK